MMEIVVVMAIMSILTGVGVLAMTEIREVGRVAGEVRNVLTLIQDARSSSVAKGVRHGVAFTGQTYANPEMRNRVFEYRKTAEDPLVVTAGWAAFDGGTDRELTERHVFGGFEGAGRDNNPIAMTFGGSSLGDGSEMYSRPSPYLPSTDLSISFSPTDGRPTVVTGGNIVTLPETATYIVLWDLRRDVASDSPPSANNPTRRRIEFTNTGNAKISRDFP